MSLGKNVVHLVLRDDQTMEDAWVLADQLGEILRYTTGEVHVTTDDDWMVCHGAQWDTDHPCGPVDAWASIPVDDAGPVGEDCHVLPVPDPQTPTVAADGDIVGLEGFPCGPDEWAPQTSTLFDAAADVAVHERRLFAILAALHRPAVTRLIDAANNWTLQGLAHIVLTAVEQSDMFPDGRAIPRHGDSG